MATELEQLTLDLEVVWSHLNGSQSVLAILADVTDLDLQNYRHQMADLMLRVYSHASGLALLIPAGYREPSFATARAMYEAQIVLSYIATHAERHAEAVIYLAASYLKQLERHAGDQIHVDEWRSCLVRMPSHLVAEAKRRLATKPFTWSRATIAAMAKAAGMRRHKELYDMLSAETHSSIASERLTLHPASGTGRTLTLSLALRGREAESLANMARRALKWSGQWTWEALGAPPMHFATSDPDGWQ